MAATNSSSSYKLETLVTLLCRYRVISSDSWWGHHTHRRDLPPYRLRCGGSADEGLRFISVTAATAYGQKPKFGMEMNESEEPQVRPALPTPPKFGFSNWMKWLLGSILTLMLPFWTNKWANMLTLERKAVKVAEEVEVVAEAVEKVATTMDKALADVANQLPDGSKLKEAAQVMEHLSIVAAQDAQLIENTIHKVGDVKQDLEDLDTMVEPIVDKIIQGKHQDHQ